MRNFDDWFSTFRSSISDYKYYVDFEKVYKNIDDIKVELHILNSLIGSHDFDNDFKKICNQYPSVLKCIPILLAIRQYEIEVTTLNTTITYQFQVIDDYILSKKNIDQYLEFLDKTGLKELIEKHIINNLVDYVLGIEVGLDSNGRKNRGGHLMEDLLERYIKELGVEYYKELRTQDIEDKWNVDLSSLTHMGSVTKRFDFVVIKDKQIYLFETNFYKSQGSKLNETARSYKKIAEEVKNIKNITFVWVTDGYGWKSAKHNLQETFDVLDTLYNIKDLENGILNKVIQ